MPASPMLIKTTGSSVVIMDGAMLTNRHLMLPGSAG